MAWDAVVVMGVSGCGKSLVAAALADRLHALPFLEGDTFHPPANIIKMTGGIALSDEDRYPWLKAIQEAIERHGTRPVIVSCSALKRDYRTLLSRNRHATTLFVYLHVDRLELERRLQARTRHFFNPSLLDSQLSTLQIPGPDENSITVYPDNIEKMIDLIVHKLEQ